MRTLRKARYSCRAPYKNIPTMRWNVPQQLLKVCAKLNLSIYSISLDGLTVSIDGEIDRLRLRIIIHFSLQIDYVFQGIDPVQFPGLSLGSVLHLHLCLEFVGNRLFLALVSRN